MSKTELITVVCDEVVDALKLMRLHHEVSRDKVELHSCVAMAEYMRVWFLELKSRDPRQKKNKRMIDASFRTFKREQVKLELKDDRWKRIRLGCRAYKYAHYHPNQSNFKNM